MSFIADFISHMLVRQQRLNRWVCCERLNAYLMSFSMSISNIWTISQSSSWFQ